VKTKAIFNWSSGKDSALSLYKILNSGAYEVMCLLTSVNEQFQRVSMHGLRLELLEAQTKSIGIPLKKMMVPEMPSMESYEKAMREVLSVLKADGAEASVFGDIFLEDLRAYREKKLSEVGMRGVFPLWKQDSKELINEFLRLGFKTIVTCVSEQYLGKEFVGRVIDEDFLKELPKEVDPCGENGEFHTFTFDGPLFTKPIEFEIGEIVYRKYESKSKDDSSEYDCESVEDSPFTYGFWYCDLKKI
jgi:uncharacterized protein (TIGR00290 family)